MDQARFLGQRYEHLRRDVAVLFVVPAQESFGTDDGAVAHTHDRLIMDLESVILHRVAKRAFQGVLLHSSGSEVDVEELVGVAPKLLGAVHRHVGVLEQALGIVAVVGIDRNAYRRGDIDVVVLDPERLRNGRLQLLRDTA